LILFCRKVIIINLQSLTISNIVCLALSGVLEWLTLRSVLCSDIVAGDVSRILLLFQHLLHYATNLRWIGDFLSIWANIWFFKCIVVDLLKHVKLSLDLIIY